MRPVKQGWVNMEHGEVTLRAEGRGDISLELSDIRERLWNLGVWGWQQESIMPMKKVMSITVLPGLAPKDSVSLLRLGCGPCWAGPC